jgi:hypothetical protein
MAREELPVIALPVILFGTLKHTLTTSPVGAGAGGLAGILFPSGQIEVYFDQIEHEGESSLPSISLSRDKIAHVFVAADATSDEDVAVLNEYMGTHYSRLVPMTLFLEGTSVERHEFVRKIGAMHKHSITLLENAEPNNKLERFRFVHHRTTVHSTMLVYMGMGTVPS